MVDKVGWEGGYGKHVRIRHANGYETAYGHMTAFAKGMEPGVRVRQGQVIGFVGSTGLSTGAHVHYEVLVNGRFVDPMRIKLPRGRALEGPTLATFEQERDRLDSMMARQPGRVAANANIKVEIRQIETRNGRAKPGHLRFNGLRVGGLRRLRDRLAVEGQALLAGRHLHACRRP